MERLTDEQMLRLRTFLAGQGLTFKPLLDEMVDHASCDLEERMSQGISFDQAWQQWLNDIPDNHFQIIQNETMETINKRFNMSRGLSYLALALLFISMFFKVMHLQGGEYTLLLSFGVIAASLLTGSVSVIDLNRERKGVIRVLTVVGGIVILLIGYGFRLLHLPGADEIIFLAVIVIISSLLVNTLFVFRHASGSGNLLTYLHEKYTPGIERFLLILLFPLVLYKIASLMVQPGSYVGDLILLVVIFGSGLQLIALAWRIMEKNMAKRNRIFLFALITSFTCLTLPFLGRILPFEFRVGLIVLFSMVSGWLAYNMEEQKNLSNLILAFLIPVIFTGWALIRLAIIPSTTNSIFFNLPILLALIIGLLSCRKYSIMRAYLIISLSSYLFEYPHESGMLWPIP